MAGWRTSRRVWVEKPLFSQTKSTGARRITAKFRLSWKMPSSTVPSPKKVTATSSRPSITKASAVPTATAMVCAEDRRRRDDPRVGIVEVNGAAAPARAAGLASVQLGHHSGRSPPFAR